MSRIEKVIDYLFSNHRWLIVIGKQQCALFGNYDCPVFGNKVIQFGGLKEGINCQIQKWFFGDLVGNFYRID